MDTAESERRLIDAMPTGEAWCLEPGSELRKLAVAPAEEMALADTYIYRMSRLEFFITEATEFGLRKWWSMTLGIDFDFPVNIEEARQVLLAFVRGRENWTTLAVKEVLQGLGYTVTTIVSPAPHTVLSPVTYPLWSNVSWFIYYSEIQTISPQKDAYVTAILERIVDAHIDLVFVFK